MGETFELKAALIETTKKWEEVMGGGVPCPIELDTENLRETTVLDKELRKVDRGFGFLQAVCGLGEEGWALPEDHEDAWRS